MTGVNCNIDTKLLLMKRRLFCKDLSFDNENQCDVTKGDFDTLLGEVNHPSDDIAPLLKVLDLMEPFFNTVTNIKTELLMNVFVVCTQVAIFDVLRAERNKNCGNNFCCSRTPPRPFQNSICINQHFYSQEVQSTLMIFACRI